MFPHASRCHRRQGPEALEAAIPRAAAHIVSVTRRLLEDEPGARVLMMPVMPGGDYAQPLPQRLAYPNRSAPPGTRFVACLRQHAACSICTAQSRLLSYCLQKVGRCM